MDKLIFDTERFISEIKQRPILWDPAQPEHCNKDKKDEVWEELTSTFIFGWNDITVNEQQKTVKCLRKRWKNIRDCFKKELNATKSKSGLRRRREYIFYKQLKFLIPVAQVKELANSAPPPESPGNVNGEDGDSTLEEETSRSQHSEQNLRRRFVSQPDSEYSARKRQKIEDRLLEVLSKNVSARQEASSAQDDDKLFLLSLVSELKRVSPDRKLGLKMDILSCIQKAQVNSTYAYDVSSRTSNSSIDDQLSEVKSEVLTEL